MEQIHLTPMNDRLAEQDQQRMLALLREGPGTVLELATRLRMTVARTNFLMQVLVRNGLVWAPRHVSCGQGRQIELWEIRQDS